MSAATNSMSASDHKHAGYKGTGGTPKQCSRESESFQTGGTILCAARRSTASRQCTYQVDLSGGEWLARTCKSTASGEHEITARALRQTRFPDHAFSIFCPKCNTWWNTRGWDDPETKISVQSLLNVEEVGDGSGKSRSTGDE